MMTDPSDLFEDTTRSEATYRMSRKHGEKLRRDRLNNLITQLAEEVPTVKYAHRRLDKSAILRLTVSYMKLHKGIKDISIKGSAFLSKVSLFNKVQETAVLVAEETGMILFVSPKIQEMLGFYQTDMIGYSIDRFIHPDDVEYFDSQVTNDVNPASPCSDSNGREKKAFYIRMLKLSRKRQDIITQEKEYELMKIFCYKERCHSTSKNGSGYWTVACIMPHRNELAKEVDVRVSEFYKNDEWASMHSLDGTMITVDQRSSLYHGYMVTELMGKTPYLFIRDEDLENVALSHKLIMKDGMIPSTVFRMKNSLNIDLYVCSKSVIIHDKWTKNPKNIVSLNTVLSEEEGKLMLANQKQMVEDILAKSEQLRISEEGQVDVSVCQDTTNPDKAEMTTVTTVKEEVIEDDKSSPQSNLSDISYSLAVNMSSIRNLASEIQESSGRQLCDVHDEMSRSYPLLYSNDSSSVLQSDSIKRTRDNCREDSSAAVGSLCNIPVHENGKNKRLVISQNDSLSSYQSSPECLDTADKQCSVDLCQKDEMCATCVPHQTVNISSNEGHPILKGILEGRVAMEKVTVKRSEGSGSRNNLQSHDITHQELATMPDCSSVESVSPSVQSPTIGSSSPQPNTMPQHINIHFINQLQDKHLKLSTSLKSQKESLDTLCKELQTTKNNLHMSTSQEMCHLQLMAKIKQAENAISAQGQYLQDLHEDIQKQNIHCHTSET